MAAKWYKNWRRISLSSRKKENYKSNTKIDTNLDYVNNKYQLQLWVTLGEKLIVTKKRKLKMAKGKNIIKWLKKKKNCPSVGRFYIYHNYKI